jgi:pilus assembly protein FimV
MDSKTEEVAATKVEVPKAEEKSDFESFDFDDFAMDSKTEEVPTTKVEATVAEEKNDFESFDFDDFALDSKTEEVPFDFDLAESAVDAKELNDIDDSSIDFDFDFDMPATAENTQQSNFGTPSLTNMNDFETQLDIAKAYIEMGDPESARNITEEVLKKGTAQQKKTAETILESLK